MQPQTENRKLELPHFEKPLESPQNTKSKIPFLNYSPGTSWRIFIVDDDLEVLSLLRSYFEFEGHTVTEFTNGEDALKAVESGIAGGQLACDLMISDLKLPGLDGVELVEKLKALNHWIPVILVTANASVESAVEALRSGAYDYITKPVNLSELSVISDRAIRLVNLEKGFNDLREQMARNQKMGKIIGKSKEMQKVFDLIERVAKTSSNILIAGESGTGKEIVARTIHDMSSQRDKPFVAVNCAAIPETLLESELFGHAKGSFTGATHHRKGLFEEAHGGTIFLDEIGDLPLHLQAKLLRVIQEKKVRPVGENDLRDIDVRIIAASHRDIKQACHLGTFREDLFFRLSVIKILIPPLRERREDIPLLIEHFFKKYANVNSNIVGISRTAIAKLMRLPWKGNVRELENAVERALVLCKGTVVNEEDVFVDLESGVNERIDSFFSALPTLERLERDYISYVLSVTEDKNEKTSEILGINRKTLYRKKKEYGLQPDALGSSVPSKALA